MGRRRDILDKTYWKEKDRTKEAAFKNKNINQVLK
jgi:hypothetical protein